MGAGDGEHRLADAAGRQRIGGEPAGGRVHRVPGPQGLEERRRRLGLDADHGHPPAVPGGDAADEAAAADGHQQRVEQRLLLELQRERALPEQRLGLIVGVHGQRAGLARPRLGGGQRVGVALAADDQLGAVAPDARDLGRRRHRRYEDLRRRPHPHRRVSDGGAVVAAGGRHHAGGRDGAGQEIGEGPASLERAGVLEQLQLERERKGNQPEVGAGRGQGRRQPDVGPDDRVRLLDGGAIDGDGGRTHDRRC